MLPTLTCHIARLSVTLRCPKPGKTNKADALSRCPDYKERIASDNAEKILLTPANFCIQAVRTTAVPTGLDTDLKAAIQEAIKSDCLSSQKLKEILLSGPRSFTKGLQEWNYEDGLILYKGSVYVPNNENLKCKVTQQFHDNVMGHPGEWKTIELISREYWWPGITEFVKAYVCRDSLLL